MKPIVWFRFDAPMMSFGGESIDSHNITRRYPSTSMLTGMIANALGWHHRDFERLDVLQQSISFAARADVPGELLSDYHTVDLGQPFLLDSNGWTTGHMLEKRAGQSSQGTHIRQRDYIADAVYSIAIALDPEHSPVSMDALVTALKTPARPLFIGRKCCLPAMMRVEQVMGGSPREVLSQEVPLSERYTTLGQTPPAHVSIWWTTPSPVNDSTTTSRLISDTRDWKNQVHTGQQWLAHGMVLTDQLPTI